jgi:hypothetical protein
VLLAGLLAFAAGSTAAPRFVLVFRLARPHASAARALALARACGIELAAVRKTPSSYIVTEPTATRELVLYRASGGFDYVDRAAFRHAPGGPLPTLGQARRAAMRFLRSHGLLPATSARVDVRPDSRATPTAVVVTLTPLFGRARVLEGAVTLWLGARNTITRLRDEYRPPTANALRIAPRPRAAVLDDIRADLGTTAGIRLRLAYVAQPSDLPQPYLDPVYEAVARGFVLDRVRATTFTPRAVVTAPNPDRPLAAGATVHLRARATEGKRPYLFAWSANRSGFLGTGRALDVPLRADDTEVRLTIRDASGAGTSYVWPVRVFGPSALAPASPASSRQTATTFGDGTISFRADQNRTHPVYFKDVEAGGLPRSSDVYFDHFRYALLVRYQGAGYHVTSAKCVPLAVRGDACGLPTSPYAQSDGASAPVTDGSGVRVDSTLAISGLPGRLQLLVEGSAESAYCGPNGELGSIGLGLLPQFVYGAGRGLGGDCPGFRPSVEWSYRPPAAFKPSDFAHLCLQRTGLCDVPPSLLAQWSTGAFDSGPQPQITDFRLSVYTAVSGTADPERVALAKDGDSALRLAATDGAVDQSCRPPALRGLKQLRDNDDFTCIAPLALERSAVLAVPDGRGDWDDVHLKAESAVPHGISFPGCNHPLTPSDTPSCIHLHEHWPGIGHAYSRGQEVTVFVVRRKPGEASPASVEKLVSGDPLRQSSDRGYDLVLWHRSTASSTECYPSGGVDNTDRPCRVFPQALFFTPR